MEAKGESFSIFKSSSIYKIPFFQRPYIWGREEWEDLLSTLLDKTGSHFIGSVIAKEINQSSTVKMPGDYLYYELVDGQQRFTTISILLRVIYDLSPKNYQKSMDMESFLFCYDEKGNTFAKVQPSKLDSIDFNKIILGDGLSEKERKSITDTSSKMMNCFKYFYSKLASFSIEDLRNLFNVITSPAKAIFVFVSLGIGDKEQEIFDSVNNKGIPLTSADTIKNAIFERALNLAGDDEVKRNKVMQKYHDVWEDFFYKTQDNLNFWDKERITGRIKRTNMDVFFSCFAVIEKIFEIGNDSINDLADSYKKYICNKNYDQMIQLIDNIDGYAYFYYNELDDYDNSPEIDIDNQVQRILYIFNSLNMTTWYPYLLYILKKYDNNFQTRDKELKKMETYIIRVTVAKANSLSKNYNRDCYSAINGGFTFDKALQRTDINDNMVISGLENIKSNYIAHMILFMIELKRRKNNKADKQSLADNFSLEHIMPQKYQANWDVDMLPVYDRDGKQVDIKVDKEKAIQIRENAIYSIGNMTLLNRALNSSISNSDFKTKVEGRGRLHGYKICSDLLITREDILNNVRRRNNSVDEAI
jgi:uncharacterized protein with ParB-like and HNH nuclease domain